MGKKGIKEVQTSSYKLPKIKVLCLTNYVQPETTVQLLLPRLPSFNSKPFSSSFRRKFNYHVPLTLSGMLLKGKEVILKHYLKMVV